MAGDSDGTGDRRRDARHERRLPPAGPDPPASAHALTREAWLVAALAAAVGALGVVGSDALWLVPLGREIAHGHLPGSIPFATAPTHGWHDVPAGAELVFFALYRALGGLRGIVVAQSAAMAVGFGALAAGLRRNAALPVAAVVLAGSIPAVAVAGVQLFSVALFSLLLLLLESASRSIWLAVPLFALWGNLHGGVLVGLGLLACYAVLHRPRALPVLAVSVLAVFANPALWSTPRYYAHVFGTVVAREGKGMWGPLGASGFDIALVVAAIVLLAAIARRPDVRVWEAVALLGLAAATVHAARTGTFFLFVAAYPAARALRPRPLRSSVVTSAAIVLTVLAVALLVVGPTDPGSSRLAAEAARGQRTVLAEPILGQQVVLAGGRVWIDNPVDAFREPDQRLYVDWLYGSSDAAVAHAALVLVAPASKAGRRAARDPRLTRIGADAHAVLYRVSRG
ncbi:MAG: hypothetical protein KGL94_02780 [Acidobacteriota bacterium]|nr:hypothetical protein [Acidobacteriota bacterium]